LANGNVLIAGGGGEFASLASAELYDPTSGIWIATGMLSTSARVALSATLLPNGKVLIAGGEGPSGILTSAELYDAASGHWAPSGTVGLARLGSPLTLLLTGKVLAVDTFPFIAPSAALYDPASDSWMPTGSAAPQESPTATLLLDGKVLLAGFEPRAELYDPASGTWAMTGGLITDRFAHTATMLPNGNVLVAGGLGVDFDGQVVSIANAEIYDAGATAQQRTANIIPQVQLLVAGGTLSANQGTVLTTKLNSVISKLNSGQTGAAGNQLGAFSNQVGAFINSGSLTPAQGQPLINAAAAIKSQIGS